MTTLPEEAVKAAQNAIRTANWEYGITDADMAKAITAALPFLPVQGAVKKLEWQDTGGGYEDRNSYAQTRIGRYEAFEIRLRKETVYGWSRGSGDEKADSFEAAKAAAQADYEARILSALEPSAARDLALEEIIALCKDYAEDSQPDSEYRLACNDIIEAIQERRTLSSPDHADAGKVEGDGIERTEFNRGYVLACANIVNLHGADVAVMEGFAQLGISKAELKALDLCEYDQRAIDALEDYFGADKLYRTSPPASEGAE